MATTLFMMFSLGLHLIAIGGLAHISMLIHNGDLQDAVITSVVTAFCILVIAWALAKANAWFS